MNWTHPAFDIPNNILESGGKSDLKGNLEKEWLSELNNSKKEIKNSFNQLNNKIFREELNKLIFSEKRTLLY